MKSTLVLTAVVTGLLLAPVGALAAGTVNWQIPLKARAGFARVSGSAQYQAQPGQRELQIEIARLRSLAGRSVRVLVNGATVGSAKVSATGIAQLTRNTERGQTVPAIVHGSTVSVQTPAGAVITSGTF